MSEQIENPPAFPEQGYTRPNGEFQWPISGMTLRDFFAGQALAGLSVNQEMLLANQDLINSFGTIGIDKLQANKAYRRADAMLTERTKGQPK